MFGIAGRRIAEAVVALFALLGFVFVPLGQKTAFQHACAIFTTPAALSAFHELAGATDRLQKKLVQAVAPSEPADPSSEPKAELPKLAKRPK